MSFSERIGGVLVAPRKTFALLAAGAARPSDVALLVVLRLVAGELDRFARAIGTARDIGVGAAAQEILATTSVVLGVSSSGLRSEALARCPPNNCSAGDAAAAQSLEDRARGRALAADLGFGLAGAAAIGAVALWIWGAPASSAPIEVAPTTQGLVIGGRF